MRLPDTVTDVCDYNLVRGYWFIPPPQPPSLSLVILKCYVTKTHDVYAK